MESNERYYRRRAIEERMAARRAMTDQAKAWHAKLAEGFRCPRHRLDGRRQLREQCADRLTRAAPAPRAPVLF